MSEYKYYECENLVKREFKMFSYFKWIRLKKSTTFHLYYE